MHSHCTINAHTHNNQWTTHEQPMKNQWAINAQSTHNQLTTNEQSMQTQWTVHVQSMNHQCTTKEQSMNNHCTTNEKWMNDRWTTSMLPFACWLRAYKNCLDLLGRVSIRPEFTRTASQWHTTADPGNFCTCCFARFANYVHNASFVTRQCSIALDSTHYHAIALNSTS